MDNVRFKASDLWDVIVKARLLQIYAVTKFPDKESEIFYNRGRGMVDAMRQIFGMGPCLEIEKAITAEIALQYTKKYTTEFIDRENEDIRMSLAEFSVETIEKMKLAASSFDRMRSEYVANATELLKNLDKKKDESNPKRIK